MNPDDLATLVALALAAELHELETDLDAARLARAEAYVRWLRGEA